MSDTEPWPMPVALLTRETQVSPPSVDRYRPPPEKVASAVPARTRFGLLAETAMLRTRYGASKADVPVVPVAFQCIPPSVDLKTPAAPNPATPMFCTLLNEPVPA